MNQDRITYDQLSQLLDGRDRPAAHAIDTAARGVNAAEHAIRQLSATEVKYVRSYGQAIPQTVVSANHYLISPAFNGMELDARTLEWCIRLCKENPPWRLSVQQHKLYGIL